MGFAFYINRDLSTMVKLELLIPLITSHRLFLELPVRHYQNLNCKTSLITNLPRVLSAGCSFFQTRKNKIKLCLFLQITINLRSTIRNQFVFSNKAPLQEKSEERNPEVRRVLELPRCRVTGQPSDYVNVYSKQRSRCGSTKTHKTQLVF